MTPPCSRPCLRLLSLNVDGLQSPAKRTTLFHSLMTGAWDIILLQETHHRDLDQATRWTQAGAGPGLPWQGRSAWAHGTTSSCGVAILSSPSLPATDWVVRQADPQGRILRVDFTLHGSSFSLVNAYAPHTPADRTAFFLQDLLPILPATPLPPRHSLLLAGDFNCISDAADQLHSATTNRFQGFADGLQPIQDLYGLVDCWRHLHPHMQEFTKTTCNAHGPTAARLDRWLIPDSSLATITRCAHVSHLPGDHLGVELTLSFPDHVLRGPGAWSLHLPLLADTTFISWFQQQARRYLARPLPPTMDRRTRWDNFKRFARDRIQQYQSEHLQKVNQEVQRLTRLVRSAQRAVSTSASSGSTAAVYQWEEARSRLQEHQRQRALKAALHAGILWQDFGEQSTFWFHRLGQQRQAATFIPSLQPSRDLPAPLPISLSSDSGRRQAAQVITDYYSSDSPSGLFRPGAVSIPDQDMLLASLDRTLSAADRTHCEGPLADGTVTAEDLLQALSSTPRGKRPGTDGLPYEFYRTFWGVLGVELAAVFNEAFLSDSTVALSPSQRSGSIVLIHKKGDKTTLDNYRPITLLNADYKILAKLLATRMGPPLARTLDITQTAFLPDRWIGDNILCHLEEIDYLEAAMEPGCIVFLDFNKAYDRMDRGWLHRCLQALDFGPHLQRWVSLLLAGTQAQVRFNGWSTPPFPISSGVAQGSPLSPLLYNICAQPLASHFRHLQRSLLISPILLPDGSPAPPTHQHADDTTLHLASRQDLVVAITQGIQPFCAATNSAINVEKTKAMLVGSAPPFTGPDPDTGIIFSPRGDTIRHLGVLLGPYPDGDRHSRFGQLFHALASRVRHWSAHQLSLLGRVHVAKQCLASMLYFHATFYSPSTTVLSSYVSTIMAFVADTPMGLHPRRSISALSWHLGGIQLPDIPNMIRAHQARIITRLLQPDPHPWKVFTYQWLYRAPSWYNAHPGAPIRPLDHLHYGSRLLLSSASLIHHAMPARVLGYCQAFRHLQPNLLSDPSTFLPAHIHMEPLYHNPLITSPLPPYLPFLPPALPASPSVTIVADILPFSRASLAPPHGLIFSCLPSHWASIPPPALATHPDDRTHLDPSMWGFGDVPILSATVRHLVQRMVSLQLHKEDPSYQPGIPLKPKIWVENWIDTASLQGLPALESRWLIPPSRRRSAEDAGLDVGLPAWLRVQRPRLHWRDRQHQATLQQPLPPSTRTRWWSCLVRIPPAPISPAPPRPPWAGVWSRIHESRAPRAYHEVAWKVLHGSLMCGAYSQYIRQVPSAAQASCHLPSCLSAGCSQTLSHLFMDCPLAVTVTTWVCDLWMAITGTRPPRTIAVFLLDDRRHWKPPASLDDLWTFIRLTTLHALWVGRPSPVQALPSPTGITARIIHQLRQAIQHDFLRATSSPADFSVVPQWLPQRHRFTLADFSAMWCYDSVLCSVTRTPRPVLCILLSNLAPVRIPPTV